MTDALINGIVVFVLAMTELSRSSESKDFAPSGDQRVPRRLRRSPETSMMVASTSTWGVGMSRSLTTFRT